MTIDKTIDSATDMVIDGRKLMPWTVCWHQGSTLAWKMAQIEDDDSLASLLTQPTSEKADPDLDVLSASSADESLQLDELDNLLNEDV